MAFIFYDNFRQINFNKAYKYLKIKTQLCLISEDIWFNKQCLINNLTPNYINISTKSSTKAADKATKIARTAWLKEEIKCLYNKKDQLNSTLYELYLQVTKNFTSLQWDIFSEHIHLVIINKIRNKHNTLLNKLNKLKINQPRLSFNQYDLFNFNTEIVNLTKVKFNDRESELLNKGFKFNINKTFKEREIKQLIIESEEAITHVPLEDKETCRHIIKDKINKIIKLENNNIAYNKDKLIINNIKKKIKDNNIIVTKADKGNAIVFINKNQYIQKTEQFFQDNNIIKINKDPTSHIHNKIKNTIKNTEFILNSKDKQRLIHMNPTAPTLKSFPKIHKNNTPIRPIVNFMNSPTYNLSKFIHQFLKHNYTFLNNRSINNTNMFINGIKDITINSNSKLISYDIINMYTNIPIPETIEIIKSNLHQFNKLSHHEIEEFITLLQIATEYNYFQFNNEYYQQINGLPMGSPLSSILADIYLNHLENNLFNSTNKDTSAIMKWIRYVDDIFVILDTSLMQPDELLHIINNLDTHIKFTMEIENNNKLNYLDLTIIRHNTNLIFNIFRKPTTTIGAINYNSNHPNIHKVSIYKNMINRLLNTPLNKDNKQHEISIIKQIAQHNNFNPSLIDKLLNRQQRKINMKHSQLKFSNNKDKQNKYTCFTYVNKNIYKITNVFKKYNLNIAFKTNNNIKNHIFNSHIINNTDLYKKSGVYKLNCKTTDCKCSYVGQTGRQFSCRYKEHKNAIRYNKISAFAEHIYLNNHSFSNIENDMEILHIINKGYNLNILENLEIYIDKYKNKDNNLNEHRIDNPLFQTITTQFQLD